jgi:hypothetical protein
MKLSCFLLLALFIFSFVSANTSSAASKKEDVRKYLTNMAIAKEFVISDPDPKKEIEIAFIATLLWTADAPINPSPEQFQIGEVLLNSMVEDAATKVADKEYWNKESQRTGCNAKEIRRLWEKRLAALKYAQSKTKSR